VGGIPTMVTDGKDDLLVPPKDAPALAEAIDRVIGDEKMRRGLIRQGLDSARRQTLERFVETLMGVLEGSEGGPGGNRP